MSGRLVGWLRKPDGFLFSLFFCFPCACSTVVLPYFAGVVTSRPSSTVLVFRYGPCVESAMSTVSSAIQTVDTLSPTTCKVTQTRPVDEAMFDLLRSWYVCGTMRPVTTVDLNMGKHGESSCKRARAHTSYLERLVPLPTALLTRWAFGDKN